MAREREGSMRFVHDKQWSLWASFPDPFDYYVPLKKGKCQYLQPQLLTFVCVYVSLSDI